MGRPPFARGKADGPAGVGTGDEDFAVGIEDRHPRQLVEVAGDFSDGPVGVLDRNEQRTRIQSLSQTPDHLCAVGKPRVEPQADVVLFQERLLGIEIAGQIAARFR